MPSLKNILLNLFCSIVFIMLSARLLAQPCSGSWDIGSSLNYGCIYGKWIGQSNSNLEPSGCPVNPIYTSGQSNTFTFLNPVNSFFIDFEGFSSASSCARMEIKINNVFYSLNASNVTDIPSSVGCNGSFDFILVSNEGYITSTVNSLSFSNGHGRIIINGVIANSITISTNDPAGTIVSAPFSCSTIPIKLESFTGQNISVCSVALIWKTGIEQNVYSIEIQKSDEGTIFYKVGEVNPKGSNSRYLFTTENFSDAFFRLKINDRDGYYEYSEIVYLKSTCNDDSYAINPNPVSNEVKIANLKKTDKIIVLDITGKIVIQKFDHIGNNLNVKSLPRGIYVIRIINESNCNTNLKMIKI